MNVVILGATGFLGRKTLELALKQEYQVTVLVRDKSRLTISHPRLNIVEGQVLNREDVDRVMMRQDAVLQVLGYNGKGDGKPTSFTTDATRVIMDSMQTHGVSRLIVMSVVGAGNSIAFYPKLLSRVVFPVFMPWLLHIINDKNAMEQLVMERNLAWTIVRATTLKDEAPRTQPRVSLDGVGMKYSVSVEAVARFLVDQLEDETFVKQAPTISK